MIIKMKNLFMLIENKLGTDICFSFEMGIIKKNKCYFGYDSNSTCI